MNSTLHKLLPDILQQLESLPIDLYWCDIEANFEPLSAFERIVTTLATAKPKGEKGKEVWINLTGGSNIINTSLQMAMSLLGRSGRMYYTFTQNPELVRHPIPERDIGQEKDDFWVDIPIIYSAFNPDYRWFLEEIATVPNDNGMTIDHLYAVVQRAVSERSLGFDPEDKQALYRQYILPLWSQGLLDCESNQTGEIAVVRIGNAWDQLQYYYKVVEEADKAQGEELENRQAGLPQLAKEQKIAWFHPAAGVAHPHRGD
jgi:hypothetical protein